MDHQRGRVRVERGAKRVRVFLSGEAIADTRTPLLVWEGPHYPVYYFPVADVRMEQLTSSARVDDSPSRGDAHFFDVGAGGLVASDGASWYPHSPIEELREHVRFDWAAMDGWFEEDEEVFVHARNPYARVDILPSSRYVEVIASGITLAETTRPTLLFETGLVTRYYLPKVDVRMDLLTPSETSSGCPYKGFARYWSVQVGDDTLTDVAWSYPTPLPESTRIAGLVAFYNERVDLRVDGVLQEE